MMARACAMSAAMQRKEAIVERNQLLDGRSWQLNVDFAKSVQNPSLWE